MQANLRSAESEQNPLTQTTFISQQTTACNSEERLNMAPQTIALQSTLDKPNQEVDQRIIATQVLIVAEGALKHVSDSGRKDKIREAFHDLKIEESQYTVLAGFNEALIRSGSYLEEIHIFCSVEVPNSLLFLIRLGNILSPYPGIVFTPLSGYKTPVFKDDGTIWDYDYLCLHCATYSDIYVKEILHSNSNIFTTGGCPSSYVPASGCPEGAGNDNCGSKEDKGHSHSDNNNPDQSNHEDDPDSEDAGNRDSSIPGTSFAAQAKLSKGTSNLSCSKPFQVLEISGTLAVQTTLGQLKPKRSLSKSHVEFKKLNFQSMKSAGMAYEQVYVGVEINANDENTVIDILQPLKTPAFNQEEIMATKAITSGTAMVPVGTTPSGLFFGNKLRETSSSMDNQRHHSRITEYDSDGAASWGFCVDDVNERQSGIGFGRHRAHPSVDFKFFGPKDTGPPAPPPAHFDVLVTSYWSLVSGNDSGLGPEMTKAPLYSNFCQAVKLEVPSQDSQLPEEPFHKSVSLEILYQ